MSQVLLNAWLPVVTALVAVIGGLIAAGKAVSEMHRANVQRTEDMRWKRAEMAKKCLDEIFADPLSSAALKMLDWNNRTYDKPGGRRSAAISHQYRRDALRIAGTLFSAEGEEQFIRDAFDALFDGLQMLEHFIRIDLIEFSDVQRPLAYYVKRLSSPAEYPVIHSFLQAYDFELSDSFLNRFAEWKANQPLQQ